MSDVVKKSADVVGLDALAKEINEEHRRCEESFKAGLSHALRAGELLSEAKSQVQHGQWGEWLKKNFEGSERTAQAYMKVFRERRRLEEANPQRVADLSYRDALKELAAPQESEEGGIDNLSQEERGSFYSTPELEGGGEMDDVPDLSEGADDA